MTTAILQPSGFPERTLIARVVRAEKVGEGARARHSYEFDGIDSSLSTSEMKQAIRKAETIDPFAVLRVVTTERRFISLFDVAPKVDDWFELEILPKTMGKSGKREIRVMAFHSQLTAQGYNEHTRGYLSFARRLIDGDDDDVGGAPKTLGASASPVPAQARAIKADCKFPPEAVASRAALRSILSRIKTPYKIIIRDVGQGSLCTLLDKMNRPLAHFDMGWPISFNKSTIPTNFSAPTPNVPVIISHWDFDHILGYYKFPNVRKADWIAPPQSLGPGHKKVAQSLADAGKLKGWAGGPMILKFGKIGLCRGPARSRNDSGIAIEVTLISGKTVLLMGDARYDTFMLTKRAPDFLVVTHHGADVEGVIPKSASKKSPAVVSVGRGNKYKHPKSRALTRHRFAGWSIRQTAGGNGTRRGSRWLGP